MIVALILFGWLVILGCTLSLMWTAKRADECIDAHDTRTMGDELDAIVIDFPQHRNGGGFVA